MQYIIFSFVINVHFRCSARGNKHNAESRTFIRKNFILLSINIICSIQKFKPITCFTCFFECNFKFGNEILFALCILRFVNICTY